MNSARRGPSPLLYFVLFLPFGATSGFVTITLAALATKAGVGIDDVAALVGMTLMPQFCKFLWAPFTDALSTRKRWYVGANLVCTLTLVSFAFIPIIPANLGLLKLLVFVNSIASSFLGMAVEGLMVHATPPSGLGSAGGWSQAGNLGGSGLGGGLALILADQLKWPWVSPVVLAILLVVCNLALLPLPSLDQVKTSLGQRFGEVGRDLVALFTSRKYVLPLALCFLPAGAAAASGLFSSIAGTWHASQALVGVMNGWVSGLIMIPGSLLGGWLSDKMDRKGAYLVASVVLCVVAALVALMPRVPMSYAVLCIIYSFASGLTYGTWCAFVLEAVGGGAAATKYTIYASLANFPIWYMTRLDGLAAAKWGAVRMLLVDAAAGVVGMLLFGGLLVALRRFWPAREPLPVAVVAPTAD